MGVLRVNLPFVETAKKGPEKSPPVKNVSRIDCCKLGLVMFMGTCMVISAYLVSMREPTGYQKCAVDYKVESDPAEDGNTNLQIRPEHGRIPEKIKLQDKLLCDLSNHRADLCQLEGDVRIHGKSSSVVLVTNDLQYSSAAAKEWKVKPYTIRILDDVKPVSVRSSTDDGALRCTINRTIPAIVFSVGGFTGNFFHDFEDVIVPLYITARQFDGEVQFLVSNYHQWFVEHKYRLILKKLSKYKVVDFDNDDQVRCFPRAVVGLVYHDTMIIEPSRAPRNETMADFMKFMRETYSLKRDVAINSKENKVQKPRLMIMARNGTRRFTNAEKIASMAAALDYEVVVMDLDFPVDLDKFPIKDARLWANVSEIAGVVNGFDVMMGVHGAGLTSFVFLPAAAVFIQVVPWGRIEGIAQSEFGRPAMRAGLHYLEYSISEEESTLTELYRRDHAVFTDPASFGWEEMTNIFLGQQNVKLDLNRFRPVLEKARALLQR